MPEQEKQTFTEQAKGSITEAIGKLTGDASVKAEDKAKKRSARPPKAGTQRD